MSARFSAAVRSQTQALMRARLQAVHHPSIPAAAPALSGVKWSAVTTACLHAAATCHRWLLAKRKAQMSSKRLRVVETVSLGEKRFVAMLHVDGAHFLIGGGANGVSLLATLQPGSESGRFAEVLQQAAPGEEPLC